MISNDPDSEDDDAIRRAFEELKAAEARQLPAFGDVIARSKQAGHRPRWFVSTAAAAAVVVAAIAILPKKTNEPQAQNPPSAAAALPFDEWSQLIANASPTPTSTDTSLVWQSTTDFLLNIPPAP